MIKLFKHNNCDVEKMNLTTNNNQKPKRCGYEDDSYRDEGSYKTDKSNRCWFVVVQ